MVGFVVFATVGRANVPHPCSRPNELAAEEIRQLTLTNNALGVTNISFHFKNNSDKSLTEDLTFPSYQNSFWMEVYFCFHRDWFFTNHHPTLSLDVTNATQNPWAKNRKQRCDVQSGIKVGHHMSGCHPFPVKGLLCCMAATRSGVSAPMPLLLRCFSIISQPSGRVIGGSCRCDGCHELSDWLSCCQHNLLSSAIYVNSHCYKSDKSAERSTQGLKTSCPPSLCNHHKAKSCLFINALSSPMLL